MITTEKISTNRYAPEGADSVNLYGTSLANSLTLGQLVIAVSIRSAAAYEAQSVLKMNKMTSGSVLLDKAAGWLQKVADGSAVWSEAKSFCVDSLGISESTLPANLDSYGNRMAAVKAMKAKLDALTQSQQEEMIDMQTLVNRRDVAYSTSSNIVRALGTSMNTGAHSLVNR